MLKKIIVGSFFAFIFSFLFIVHAYSEIALSPSAGKIDIIVGSQSAALNDKDVSSEVTDFNGGIAKINYDVVTEEVDVTATSGNPNLTYLIAKIFLNEGTSISIAPNQNYKGAVFVNTSEKEDGDIVIVFLDGSKVKLTKGTSISLTYLADGNYHLKVLNGPIEYTDPKGVKRMLTSGDPVIFEKGFSEGPDAPGWRWRNADIERNPATP